MIDHLGINTTDMAAATEFYDTVLGTLGHRRLMDYGVAVGYGTEQPHFWVSTFEGVGDNREVHIAFSAPDAAAVRAFFDAAVGLGAEVLHEPRMWPEYHEHYYGGFVRDPGRQQRRGGLPHSPAGRLSPPGYSLSPAGRAC